MPVTNDTLLSYINELNARVTYLSNELDTTNLTVASNYNYSYTNINSLTTASQNTYTYLNDDVFELHNEIHDATQYLDSYVGDFDSYITSLQSDVVALQLAYNTLAYTVQNTYTYLNDDVFELHNEIHDVTQDVDAYLTDYNSYITSLQSDVVALQLAYNTLAYTVQNTYTYLTDADFGLHNEIHDVRQGIYTYIDAFDSYITTLQSNVSNLQSSYNTLAYTVQNTYTYLTDADFELHNEIHAIYSYYSPIIDDLIQRVTYLESTL